MKRTILTGILVLATGFTVLAARQVAPAQTTPPPAAAAKGPQPKSQAEAKAIMALQSAAQANQPDEIIKASDDLLTKYTDTEYKEWALGIEAKAYQMKGDAPHAQVYAQQALQINPKSYTMLLLLGEVVAVHIGEHDLDRQEKLDGATKDFNDCIEIVKTAPKPNPSLTDDQWAEYKKLTTAEAHNGLGVLAMVKKDWPTAISEFKLAIDGDPQDAYYTRLASVYQSSGHNDDAIAICDKLLANPSLHPTIKAVVTSIKNAAVAGKAKK
jgi:tetratricopeptide (TPR) repeat protein